MDANLQNRTLPDNHEKRKLISQVTQLSNNDLKGTYQELYSTLISGERPTDRHIDAANHILLDKFPDMQGLSTPLLGQKLQYPLYNFLQSYHMYKLFIVQFLSIGLLLRFVLMKTSGFLTVCFQINCHLKLKNKLPQLSKQSKI